jgi:hypothetical protein
MALLLSCAAAGVLIDSCQLLSVIASRGSQAMQVGVSASSPLPSTESTALSSSCSLPNSRLLLLFSPSSANDSSPLGLHTRTVPSMEAVASCTSEGDQPASVGASPVASTGREDRRSIDTIADV